jgi:hypothetical protein
MEAFPNEMAVARMAFPEGASAEEWDELLEGFAGAHDGRYPTQEAHYQAQLARLAAGGVEEAPETPRGPDGLTKRQLEQWHAWMAMVVEAEHTLPVDLFRDLEGWAASEKMGNVHTYRPSLDTLRQLELLAHQVGVRQRAAEDRAGKVTATLRQYFPETDPETLDGEFDPQVGMWGHLVAMAVTKDESLVDKSGADFYSYSGSIPRLTDAEATIVMALAHQLGAMRLMLAPVVEEDTRVGLRVAVVDKAMGQALEGLGLPARELTRAAKETAMRYGLPQRPTKAQDARDSAILASLLLLPSREQ